MATVDSTLVLLLDADDYKAVRAAIRMREGLMSIPSGGGNADGRAVAEVCRGWMEWMMFEEQRVAEETAAAQPQEHTDG